MNTVFLRFCPAVWLRDNHLSDCGRHAYSPAVSLHSDHLLYKPALFFSLSLVLSLPLFISQRFFLSFALFFPPPSCHLVEVVIHQTATSVRCQLALINDSDERMLNERGKWESRVIIRKALFSAYRCLLFILHGCWGRNALIGELNKLRKWARSLSQAGLRLKMWFRLFWRALLVIRIVFLFPALNRVKSYFLF